MTRTRTCAQWVAIAVSVIATAGACLWPMTVASAQDGDGTAATALERRLREIGRSARGGVVAITGGSRNERGGVVQSMGAGTLVDGDGYVLTAASVVPPSVRTVVVVFAGGRKGRADVVGRDPRNRVVLLRVQGFSTIATSAIRPLPLGDSSALRPGSIVFSVGNPFASLNRDGEPAISAGVVSSLYTVTDPTTGYRGLSIETDAAVNPGSFGGPLVDAGGRVVGIVTEGYSRRRWLGTAIPIDQIELVLDDLRTGREPAAPFLGVASQDTGGEANPEGVLVERVVRDSPADRAGLRAGDRIVGVAGARMFDPDDVREAVDALPAGSEVVLRVVRGGQAREVPLVLAARPSGDVVYLDGGVAPEAPRQPAATATPAAANPLGVSGAIVSVESGSQAHALRIDSVDAAGACGRAGLQPGDLILGIDGEPVESQDAFAARLSGLRPSARVRLRVSREGWEREITITLPAAATSVATAPAAAAPASAFLGVSVRARAEASGVSIEEVVPGSPAARAGLLAGDTIVGLDGRPIPTPDALGAALASARPGQEVAIRVLRQGWEREFRVALVAPPAPSQEAAPVPESPSAPAPRAAFLGVVVAEDRSPPAIESVTEGSPAARAGLRAQDVVVAVDGREVATRDALRAALASRQPGQRVRLIVERGGWRREIDVELGEAPPEGD